MSDASSQDPTPVQRSRGHWADRGDSSLARSKDFYQNVLGFDFLFDAGPMSFFSMWQDTVCYRNIASRQHQAERSCISA